MLSSSNKIFVIGFPKCGTTSLQESFLRVGMPSIHWGNSIDNTHVFLAAHKIETAKKEGLPLLTYLSDYKAFTQMEACIYEYCYWPQMLDTPALDSQYPNSKFIFNDRNTEKWIKSVSRWVVHGQNLRERFIKFDIPGLPKGKGKEDKELEDWYLWHKNNMIDYFKNKDNFIVFNIENDDPKKLGEFLQIENFSLPHLNRS